ncbi:SDR family NAD(P)-dependent oxidoreductase [Actinomadura darangshiensis]|uniref:SDR family NAD(P)-dependent oxidoreductase n=1 Tax=Actinomadura darangshiensis TaxID=705336 RepID=A0A4R5ASC2_9ACTN|nr:type I polyketide synthase [Actinomadura darangshiensis]TDD73312.1 SDR family NAD(P)-dependent oxidoreductase [Actinomadura darangshiensis]
MQSNDRSGAAQDHAHDETRISEDSVRRHLIEQIARRSGTTAAGIDPDRPLEEFGLASRDAVAIAGELEQMLGRSLPATLVWEHPTINKLSVALAGGPASVQEQPEPSERRAANDEPVAVVGVGLRFPGGDRDLTGPDGYWRFLTGRGDAVREVPDGRWDPFDDGSPEVGDLLDRTTRLGGFLDDVAEFDAQFFGITPREAAVMDPQQRLVLEVAWEAFEHAGLGPASLRGSRTGVFVGVSAPEYAAFTASDLASLEPFTATGAALSIIANRLSYLLDLRGPSMIVDTACSSSLVSTHLAVQALRSGEADVALAGGVNLLLSPTVTMTFDLAGGTAADGHCKAFDASADGMVRAEGCGAVVLKRLSDATRDGDRILAVIKGSGVNSDGRSNGLVAPNSEAQRALLRDVYASAGVDTREVDYVEAHGTGTFLGDPIEAKAVGEILGAGREPDKPLLLGSAKSNLGHMESAAGIAGLIKTVLALHHRVIPPSAHYKEPNPHIPFDELRLAVVAEETPWLDTGRPARAGVSGFGFGGTNAHILLEEAPEQETTVHPAVVRTFPLSDTSDDRIRDHAALLAEWLPGQEANLADVARTLHRRSGRGRSRAAVAARDQAGLVEGLAALAEGRPHPGVVSGTALGAPGRPVWVFSGYGAQRAGMAQRLLEEEPAFAEAIDDLDGLFAEEGGPDLWALLEEGRKPDGPADAMPVLFAIQIGLARMWKAYGVTPGAVIGHSMGEVAAAVVAGALTLEDGVRVICRRSRLLTRLVGGGAMAVLGASAEEVARLADGLPEVYAAVHSSPKQTVVTGDAGQVAEIVKRAEAEGRLARMVQAEGAGHSPQVDPLLPDLRELLADVGADPGTPLAAGIKLYTTALDDPRTLINATPALTPHPADTTPSNTANAPARTVTPDEGASAEASEAPAGAQAAAAAGAAPEAAGGAAAEASAGAAPAGAAMAVAGSGSAAATGSAAPDKDATGGASAGLGVEYWVANLRNAVRLTDAVAAAAEDGFRTFVEVNAHPILAHGVGETLDGTGALVTHTLKRAPKGQETDDTLTFHAQLATLAAHGHATAKPAGGRVIDVPQSPWRHERHWVDLSARRASKHDEHPLLGAHVELPGEDRHAWRADVGLAAQPWLDGLAVHGLHALPVAAFAEIALAAGATALGTEDIRVNSLWMERPLALGGHTTVTTTFTEAEQRVEVHALTPAGTWVRLASADVGEDRRAPAASEHGAATEVTAAERGSRHYRLHPEVFDRCLSVLSDEVAAGDGTVWLAETIGSLRVYGPTHRGGHVQAKVTRDDTNVTGSIALLAADGQILAEATGIVLRQAGRHDIPVPLTDKLVELTWTESPLPDTAPARASAGATPADNRSVHDGDGAEAGPVRAGAGAVSADGRAVRAGGEGVLLDGAESAGRRSAEGAAFGVGTWLVLAEDDDVLGSATVAGLEERGKRVVRHRVMDRPPDEHPAMDEPDEPVEGVVLVPSADLVDEELVLAVAGVSRSLPDGPRLYVATRSALPLAGDGLPGHGFVSALTRVLAFERTVQRATHVDVDRPADLVAELLADDDAREVAWRGGTRYVARLGQAVLPEEQGKKKRIVRRGGAYVITGGYGGIGLVTARLLAQRGAGRIVLSGRGGPGADAEKVIARLREDGVDVGVVLGDIAQPGTAERLIKVAQEGGTRLCGVVHGAGAIDDRLIADLGPDDLHRVWTAKVEGARRLSEATWDIDLDWLVMHSSAAALLGSPGQAAYAAANAAIDALMAYRRANGRPGTTINWGTWSQVGGAAEVAVTVIDPISPAEGAEALEALLVHGMNATGVLRFDPATAVGLFPEIRNMPYFAALTEAADEQQDESDWPGVEALKDLDPGIARKMIAAQVRHRIAAVLGFDPQRLDPAVPLTDLGLDSLVAVRIKSGVEHDLGLTVPASVLLQGASVNVFEEWAAGELGLADADAPQATAVSNAESGYVMPRDAAERLAVRILEDVLGLDRVGVTADFFAELGGREHQADQVVARVAQELGAEVTRGELFEVPTAENVAEYIRAADEEAARQTVRPLNRGRSGGRGGASPHSDPAGDRRPIFIAHPAGGTTACYRQLTDLLGGDQPVYGLERFEDAPPVEERAARYVQHLVEAQPEGAFRLGGWSFGGVLAYETARQLQRAGREVEFVALFDAGLPLAVDDESDTLARRFSAFADYINETYGLDVTLTYEELSGLDEESQFALVMERAAPLVDYIPPAALTHQLTSHQDTRSLEAYQPEPYDGHVILYYAPEETPWAVRDARYVLDGTNGFGGLCSDLEIVTIPGVHHLNLLDPPGVDVLAAHLEARLSGRRRRDAVPTLDTAR